MSRLILAYYWLLVMTRHVMPFYSVSIKVIQDRHTCLFLTSLLYLLSVIRLSLPCSASVRPVMELSSVSWTHLDLVGGPEPSVDVLWEEFVAAVKIAFSARGPEVWNSSVHESFDPLIFLLGLEGDEVHAPLPAVVPGVEPVPLGVPHPRVRVLPAEPVIATIKLVNTVHLGSDFAEVRVTEAKFSFVFFISATVSWEQLVSSFRPQRIDCAGAKEDLPDSTGERSEKVHDRSKKII